MRLNRLSLLRFGKFTDRVIELPKTEPDFHLIVGPNEAGKSTIRSAISDLLFGIEGQTPFNFLHAYGDLRLSAVIEDAGRTLACQRLKRAKQSLRDAADEPLSDDALAAHLGGASRDFFERMFGLDHARLIAGGLAILEAKDDVGRVLFETSAGLATLGPVREDLEREAKSLWDRRRAGDRAYYKAADAIKMAEESLKGATVRAKAWRDIESERTDAEDMLAKAVRDHEALEAERARLERIRRVAPHFQRLREAQRAQGSLDDVATNTHARLLDQQADIEALDAFRHKVKDHPHDIHNRRIEVEALARSALVIAGQLGLTVTEATGLAETLPAHPVRSELADLIQRKALIDTTMASASQALAEKESDLQTLDRDIQGISGAGASPELKIVLDAARDLGDTERQKRDAAGRIEAQRRRYEAAAAQLAPWTGSTVQLRALSVPSMDHARAVEQRENEIRTRLSTSDETLQDLAAEIATTDAAASRLRDSRHVVSLDDIVAARHARDTHWQQIKRNPKELAQAGAAYEATVAAADALADRRYTGAADAGRLETTHERIHALRANQQSQERLIARGRQELHEVTEEWSRSLAALHPFRPTPAAMADWLRCRNEALDAAEDLESAERVLVEVLRCESATETRLRSALAADGTALVAAEQLPLRSLVAFVTEIVAKADGDKARRDELESRRGNESAALEKLRARVEEARVKHSEWTRSWARAVTAAGLSPDTSPAAGATALEMLSRLDGLLDKMHDIERSRIATMERDLRLFVDDAARLAAALAPDLVGHPPEDIAAELATRSRAGTRAREHVERIAETIRVATGDAIDAGDGLPLSILAEEAQSEDLATITARLGAIDESLREAVKRRETCSDRKSRAEASRDAVHGQDDAAGAEARRQQALAEMADVTERFIKVYVASRLLGWSIDRYREEKQGPLLRRAGEIFTTLTLGSFEKLSVDFEGNAPQLIARRPGGTSVGVEGMSEGTRDQLYLALRLAAVELHLAKGHALPFVADDLFINYDDSRAAAGLRALAELATRTQVIFLTHHDHLVNVARAAVGSGVDVVSL